jgi:hypothetical protein
MFVKENSKGKNPKGVKLLITSLPGNIDNVIAI